MTKASSTSDPSGILDRNPLRYRGYYYDAETGFCYLNARYYDPVAHRFISPEPNFTAGVFDTGTGLTAYNVYAYCGNDPVNLCDSTGQFVITTAAICIGVGAAVGMAIGGIVGNVVATNQGLDVWQKAKYVISGALSGGILGTIGGDMIAPALVSMSGITGLFVTGGGVTFLNQYNYIVQCVGNPVEVLGRGSTGRIVANNLNEQMAMHQVMSDPLKYAEHLKMIIMSDTRWLAEEGWIKMQAVIEHSDRTRTVIHFVYNVVTKAFDDFKFNRNEVDVDNIKISKIWQDYMMFEVRVIAYNEYINAYQDIYLDEKSLLQLSDSFASYIENYNCCYDWNNREKERLFSIRLFPADIHGHVKIELDMAIYDSKIIDHRCKFFVESELGLVESFGKNLKGIIQGKVGTEIVLQ